MDVEGGRTVNMVGSLHESPYSGPFNTLYYMGAWANREIPKERLTCYFIHQLIATFIAVMASIFLFADLYTVRGSFNKITWNLSITTIFTGGFVKNINLYAKFRILRRLRLNLHKDATSRTDPNHLAIHEKYAKQFVRFRSLNFIAFALFAPGWLSSRYFGLVGPTRELPIPMKLPVEVNPDDLTSFTIVFVIIALSAIVGLSFVLEAEMVMYGYLIQISREYAILLGEIPKLNDLYENVIDYSGGELERNANTKSLLKQISSRQRQLIEYTKSFEKSYNIIMLLQVFVASVLILVNTIQCIMASEEYLVGLTYQFGYLAIIIFHTFMVCYYGSIIEDQCYNVGVEMYYTNWYLMDVQLQKYIIMIILRSQNPPRLTIGRALDLNVNTFTNIMKNIYSWLTLFRQLELR